MTSSTSTPSTAPISALASNLYAPHDSHHSAYLHGLATTVLHNLQYQHDWTSLTIHTHTPSALPLPRPIVSGLPPRKAYVHPDEQVEILKAEHTQGSTIKQVPEREWALPTHIEEKWSLKRFSEVFDTLDTVPPADDDDEEDDVTGEDNPSGAGKQWQGNKRQKRIFLATLHDDSTIVYYIVHDGLVKPRQN